MAVVCSGCQMPCAARKLPAGANSFMAKDPAFLFYSSDFLTGTMFMSNEQIGIYIRLLCAQHQHGAMIEEKAFNSLVKDDELLRSKFIKCVGGYYNERLMSEMSLRNKKSSNISSAMKEVWEKRKIESHGESIESYNNPNRKLPKKDGKLIGTESEDENESEDINTIKERYRESFENDFNTDEKVCRENGFNHEQLAKAKTEFWNIKELDEEMTGKSFQDVQKHFLNWCRQNKSRLKKQENAKPSYKTGHDAAQSAIRLADQILSGEYVPNDSAGNNG